MANWTLRFRSSPFVLQLEDEIDLSRGDLLVSPEIPPFSSDRFAAMVVWLHSNRSN